jgi:hypothetical protein
MRESVSRFGSVSIRRKALAHRSGMGEAWRPAKCGRRVRLRGSVYSDGLASGPSACIVCGRPN